MTDGGDVDRDFWRHATTVVEQELTRKMREIRSAIHDQDPERVRDAAKDLELAAQDLGTHAADGTQDPEEVYTDED